MGRSLFGKEIPNSINLFQLFSFFFLKIILIVKRKRELREEERIARKLLISTVKKKEENKREIRLDNLLRKMNGCTYSIILP